MVTIESSWGIITTDDDGNILDLDILEIDKYGNKCYLLEILKFDIAEWNKWYENKFKVPNPNINHFDILTLNYWNKDGSYITAKEDFRN